MDSKYASLSQIVKGEAAESEINYEYQERPYAYEFYHQFRKMIEKGLNLGGYFIQPEVNKTYQQYLLKKGKIPDFIIHIPGAGLENLCVIEFKRASSRVLKRDLEKLADFQEHLHYKFLFEVIIGTGSELSKLGRLLSYERREPKVKITIISFNIKSWQADLWIMNF